MSSNQLSWQELAYNISHGRLSVVFDALAKRMALLLPMDSSLSNRLIALKREYQAILHVVETGSPDEHREEALGHVKEELYNLCDTLRRNYYIKNHDSVYASTARFENLQKVDLESRLDNAISLCAARKFNRQNSKCGTLETEQQAFDALNDLFNSVMVCFNPSDRTLAKLRVAMNDADLDETIKVQIIAGLVFGLLVFYDARRMEFLIESCTSECCPVAARALIGTLFVMKKYSGRISSDQYLMKRFKDILELIDTQDINDAILSVVSAYDTQRISDKLENELIPDIMKIRPELMEKMRDIDPENPLASLDKNPEWEEMLSKSDITARLAELNELQQEGADIMIMPFSKLKQFPFFHRLSSWTTPFDECNPALDFDKNAAILEPLRHNNLICDNDKYSMALSLKSLPESQKAMLKMQFEAQNEQLKSDEESKLLSGINGEFNALLRNYVRDMYRVFRISKFSKDFQDPFKKPLDISRLPYIGNKLTETGIYSLIFEFYFKRGFFEEALSMAKILEYSNPTDSGLFEKEGYCHQMLGNLKEALACYSKASLLGEESLWLIKKIAYCARMSGDYSLAAEYYDKVLDIEPENHSALLNAARSLSALGRHADALKLFYKIAYLYPHSVKALREISLNELLSGNIEKSLEYYSRLLSVEKNPNDNIAAGIASFIAGDRASMLQRFAAAVGIIMAQKDTSKDDVLDEVSELIMKQASNCNVSDERLDELKLLIEVLRMK